MKKYLAIDKINWLGTKHDTRKEAELALKERNAILDTWTGFCSTFGEFSNINKGIVITYDDEHPVTKEEFFKSMDEKMKAEKQLEKDIENLRRERMAKYWAIEARYHNQVEYQEHDVLKITTRNRKTKHELVMTGRVCESVIGENGELRPELASHKQRFIPALYDIEKIEIIGNKRGFPNEHCQSRDHYQDGEICKCKHYDVEKNECKLFNDIITKKNDKRV